MFLCRPFRVLYVYVIKSSANNEDFNPSFPDNSCLSLTYVIFLAVTLPTISDAMVNKVGVGIPVLFPKSGETFKVPLSVIFPVVLYRYSCIQTLLRGFLKKSQVEIDFDLFQIY